MRNRTRTPIWAKKAAVFLIIGVLLSITFQSASASPELAHLVFDTDINDSTNRFNGTFYNGTFVTGVGTTNQSIATFAAGKIGNALDLERDFSQYVNLTNPGHLLNTTNNMAVTLWVKREQETLLYGPIGKYRGSPESGWQITIANAATSNSTEVRINGGTVATVTDQSYADWVHLAIVTNTTGVTTHARFFINGANRSEHVVISGTLNSTTPFSVGWPERGNNPWDGLIDDLRIWNTSISDVQVAEIYNDGFGSQLALDNLSTVINISLFDKTANETNPAQILNFAVNGTILSTGQNRSFSTNNGTVMFAATRNETWTFTVWNTSNPEYAVTTTSVNTRITSNSENLSINATLTNSVFLTIFDEETHERISDLVIDAEVTVEIIKSDETLSRNSSTSNSTLLISSLIPGEYEIRYSTPNYDKRSYFFTLTQGEGNEIELFLLNSTQSTLVTLLIKDENDDPFNGSIVKIQRRYVSRGGVFKIVEMSKANFNGEAPINIELNTQEYRFLVDLPLGTNIFTGIDETKITSSTLRIQIIPGGTRLATVEGLSNLQTTLLSSTDEGNVTFTYIFSDTQGFMQSGCLQVIHSNRTGSFNICDVCASSSSATLTCNVNVSAGTLRASGLVNTTNPSQIVTNFVEELISDAFVTFGQFGVFLAIMVLLGVGLMGIFSVPAAIVTGITALIMSSVMGFYVVGASALMGLVISGIFIIIKSADK